MRRFVIFLFSFAVTCGGVPSAAPSASVAPSAAHAERLFLAVGAPGSGSVAVVDAKSGVTTAEHKGILTPDGTAVVEVRQQAATTFVRGTEIKSGSRTFDTKIDGTFALASSYGAAVTGFSARGRWLALVAPQQPTASGMVSRFAVIDARNGALKGIAEAPGDFAFDAVSDDGRSLYLIEHPEGAVATVYRVRVYDLDLRQMGPTVGDIKQASPGPMNGLYHSSLASPDGDWWFSLYFDPVHGPFVHALNTPGRYALCILDIPGSSTSLPWLSMWALAPAPSRGSFVVANGAIGAVAEIGTQSHQIRSSRTSLGLSTPPLPSARRGAAAVSTDGKWLFVSGDHGLLVLDADQLAVKATWLPTETIGSVATSPDGKRLYVLTSAGALVTLDASSGSELARAAEMPGHAVAILKVD